MVQIHTPTQRLRGRKRKSTGIIFVFHVKLLLTKPPSATHSVQSSIEYFSTAGLESKNSIDALQRHTKLHKKRTTNSLPDMPLFAFYPLGSEVRCYTYP